MQLKICGLTRAEDIAAANLLKLDYIGFVFAKSRRRVTTEQAMELKSSLDPAIGAVGIFVNEDMQNVANTAGLCSLAAVQLHGDESGEYISRLRGMLPVGCEIWKAVRVRCADDIEKAKQILADCIVFDAFCGDMRGGTGESFDWSMLRGIEMSLPFFIAGGITAENAASVIDFARPDGIDASSSLETDGLKDFDKMKRLTQAVRNIDTNLV